MNWPVLCSPSGLLQADLLRSLFIPLDLGLQFYRFGWEGFDACSEINV